MNTSVYTQEAGTTTAAFDELKAKQHQIWSSGDYNKIAWVTAPISEELVGDVDLRPGARVLDVATGTGHAALVAARRFCDVIGVDYVSGLLEIARKRAVAESLDVAFQEADAEHLPFPDGSFEFVLSAIGVMFTADHQQAASELIRVCRPGGRFGIASWTPEGFVGRLLRTVGGHVPPPPSAQPPTRWGSEEAVRDMFGGGVSDVAFARRVVTQRFPSPEFFADFFLANYGPTHAASQRLSEAGRRALRADMVALAISDNIATDGTYVGDWEYLVVTGTRS